MDDSLAFFQPREDHAKDLHILLTRPMPGYPWLSSVIIAAVLATPMMEPRPGFGDNASDSWHVAWGRGLL